MQYEPRVVVRDALSATIKSMDMRPEFSEDGRGVSLYNGNKEMCEIMVERRRRLLGRKHIARITYFQPIKLEDTIELEDGIADALRKVYKRLAVESSGRVV